MLKFFFYSVKWKNMESLREAKFKAIHRVVGVGKVNFWAIAGVGLSTDSYHSHLYKRLKPITTMSLAQIIELPSSRNDCSLK